MGCSCSIPLTDEYHEKNNKFIITKNIVSNRPQDISQEIPQEILNNINGINKLKEKQEIFKKVKKIGNHNNIYHCYLIRSIETMDEYAYKIIDINDSNDKSTKKIMKNVKILKSLSHPNIILFKNAYLSDNKKYLYVFTEYADDGDLQMKLDYQSKRKMNFNEDILLNWLMQICLALKYIHNKDIINRDIKPSNIFLMKKNIIKLGDFGVNAKTMVAYTQYIAPEIIKKERYSFKADIWSLGVTFFQLIYFVYPFEGITDQEIQKNILEGKRKEVSNSGNYDKKFIDLVNSMLSYNPEERPSISEILENPIIKSRMKCYLKENNFNYLKAKNTIDEYENEIGKLKNENIKEKQICVIDEDEIKDFITFEKEKVNKIKKDKKILYDLSRQMILMETEFLRKSNS